MISIVIPLYVNLTIPLHSLRHYNQLAEKGIEVVIIDDGSEVEIDFERYEHLTTLRIPYVKPWNQPVANNLGVKIASHDYILRCDIDHLVTEEVLEEVTLPKIGEIIKFNRVVNGKPLPPNKNIFLINRIDYGEGYDEKFAGHYGHDDTDFLRKRGLKEIICQEPLIVLDIKTHDLVRDKTFNERHAKQT